MISGFVPSLSGYPMQLILSGDYLSHNIAVKDGKEVLRFDLYASLIKFT
jgi:hypothetical protein